MKKNKSDNEKKSDWEALETDWTSLEVDWTSLEMDLEIPEFAWNNINSAESDYCNLSIKKRVNKQK